MKRFLSALMLVIMLSTCIILPVSAEKPSISSTEALYGSTDAAPNTDAAYVIGTDRKTLKEAFASAPTDGTSVTYTLSDNVTYDSRLTVPAGTKITLDLAGYALTYNGTTSRSCIYVAGNLTVKGTGSVTNLSTSYNGHVFTVWTGGALTVSGDATFSADGGDAIHCVGGTVVSVSAGTFTSAKADAVSLTGLSKLLSVSGGTFIGKNALYAGAGSTVTTVSGGSFSGRQNGMYIKAAGTVKTLGEASVSSAVGGKYAVTNLGTIEKIDGAKLISTGAGTLCNYGTVGAVSAQTAFNYTSPVRGVGAAIVNYGTLGGTVEGTVTANANGILNHGGKLTTVKTTIRTVRGIGIYNRAGGMIININANITVCNRAAVFNTGEGTKITSFTGGTYISTCEKEGTTDDRAIGIHTADGATIGRIAVTKVKSYGACIANDGATITTIQRGIFTSFTISVANKNGGVIGEICNGTFTPDYDWNTVFPGVKRTMSIVGTAKLALHGGTDTQYAASQWNEGKSQFFVLPLTEEQFNEMTRPDSAYARFVNHERTDETATEDIYHYYDTCLDGAVFTSKQTARFFTSKIVPRGEGDTVYLLGFYCDETQAISSLACKTESDDYQISVSAAVSARIAATPVGQHPTTYFTKQRLVYCGEGGVFADLTVSGEARLAQLGGADLTKPASAQTGNAAQFYVIPLTEEKFNLLTPQYAVPLRYVDHTATNETATRDIYHYYDNRLTGGQVTGDSGFRFFTAKIIAREDASAQYLLGVWSESAQDVTALYCTVVTDTARAVISVDGMAPLAATPVGQYPAVYDAGQSLVSCEGLPDIPYGYVTKEDSMVTLDTGSDSIRDPFLLYYDGAWYLYRTGWLMQKTENDDFTPPFSDPVSCVEYPDDYVDNAWAPEVHEYNGRFYMFTTYYSSKTNHRGVAIFAADHPGDKFVLHSAGHVTPSDWDCIDGTFYIDGDGQPWMVFVHEWTSTDDQIGRMACAKLSDDLTHFISEPVELFTARDSAWSAGNITDGCFMYTTEEGKLLMIWSNSDAYGYCVGIAESETGLVTGPWKQQEKTLYSKSDTGSKDGGHGMFFRDAKGNLWMAIHSPNSGSERGVLIPIKESNGTLVWDTRNRGYSD